MAEQPHQEEHGAEDAAVAEAPVDPKIVAGHDAIRLMLGEVFKITAPRDFQIDAIYKLAFLKLRLLVVQKTGGGKSLLVPAALKFMGGVALVVEPLLGVGADQSRSAQSYGDSDTIVFHLDGLSLEDALLVAEELKLMNQDMRGKTILIFCSPQSLKVPMWALVLDVLLSRDLLSIAVIDEAQYVLMANFRPEFAQLKELLFAKLLASPKHIPILVMTATFTSQMKSDFQSLMGLVFDQEIWGAVGRRDISLGVEFQVQCTTSVSSCVSRNLKAASSAKVIIYSNEKERAQKNLPASIKKTLFKAGVDGDVSSFTGDTGSMMKDYLLKSLATTEASPSLNLRALCMSSAGN